VLSAAPIGVCHVSAHFDAEVRVSEVGGQSILHTGLKSMFSHEIHCDADDAMSCSSCITSTVECRLVIARRRRSTAKCCTVNLLKSQSDVREFWTAVISGGQLRSSGCRRRKAKTNACCLGECMYRARTQ